MTDLDTTTTERRAPLKGADYRVKARHPRRDIPLVVTDAAGQIIGTSGYTCDACTPEQLASMVRNGYVERIDEADTVAAAPRVAPAVPVKRRRATDRET